MTERWKSTSKYHCRICNMYMPDTTQSRRSHESSKRHRENVRNKARTDKEKRMNDREDLREQNREITRVKRLAEQQFSDDVAKGYATKPSNKLSTNYNNNNNNNNNTNTHRNSPSNKNNPKKNQQTSSGFFGMTNQNVNQTNFVIQPILYPTVVPLHYPTQGFTQPINVNIDTNDTTNTTTKPEQQQQQQQPGVEKEESKMSEWISVSTRLLPDSSDEEDDSEQHKKRINEMNKQSTKSLGGWDDQNQFDQIDKMLYKKTQLEPEIVVAPKKEGKIVFQMKSLK